MICNTLDSIISSDFFFKKQIEIIVSDNASTDKTQEVLVPYLRYIKYYRSETNQGYDKNLDNLINLAKNEFVWFLGTGEIIKPQSLSNILGLLNEDVCNIVLNFDIIDHHQNLISTCPKIKKKILNKSDFSFLRYSPALSANVVNRKLWIQAMRFPLVEFGWCHAERILKMILIAKNPKTIIFNINSFSLIREEKGWWKDKHAYKLALTHRRIICTIFKKDYSLSEFNQAKKHVNTYSIFYWVLHSKKNGAEFEYNSLSEFKNLDLNIFHYTLLLGYFYFPIIFLRVLNKVLFKLKILN